MSLTNSGKLMQLFLKNRIVLRTMIRNDHWLKDYKPAPYPKTQEEREAAAAKYGLHVSEYEPCPDDGFGRGDYPKLPDISGDAKDPFYPWDFPELKRNYCEPLHVDFDMIGENRYNISARHRKPGWRYWLEFLGTIFGSFTIYYLFENCKIFIGQLPKQYPAEGKVHYTFEPKE